MSDELRLYVSRYRYSYEPLDPVVLHYRCYINSVCKRIWPEAWHLAYVRGVVGETALVRVL